MASSEPSLSGRTFDLNNVPPPPPIPATPTHPPATASTNISSSESLQSREKIETPGQSSQNVDRARPGLQRSDSSRSIAEDMSSVREFIFVCVMCLCQFTTQVGLGQCLSIIHIIGDHYGITNPGTLSWLIAGYSLTVGTFILLAGRFGDVFGYKRMLLIGFAWSTVWTLVAGLAHYSNHVLFIFARVFQGIGPSIFVTNGLAILGATYHPGKKKDMIFAVFGATAPGGAIVGSLFAALFGQLAGAWWWSWYSFAITLAFLAATAYLVVPEPPRKSLKRSDSGSLPLWERLDLLGGGVGITALILFNFAWNQAGVVGWASPYVDVCLVIGVLLFPAFFYIEMRVSRAPLVPFQILTADVAFVLACVGLGWGSFGVWVYYLWQYLEVARGIKPLLAVAWLCPLAISGAIAAVITGLLLSRIRAAWVMTIAMCAFVTGIILVATAPVDQTYWAQIFVCTIVITFGMDMSFPASTVIISNALPRSKQGVGASLVNTVVNYSISLALGFAGTVEANVNDGNNLKGFRGALYLGIGLAGTGLAISLVFLILSYVRQSHAPRKDAGPHAGSDESELRSSGTTDTDTMRTDEKKDDVEAQ